MGVCVSLPLPSVHYPGAGNDISDVNELGLDVVHGGVRDPSPSSPGALGRGQGGPRDEGRLFAGGLYL